MGQPLLSEELWKEIEPLLPRQRPKPDGGRPPISDRNCLIGIIFVLKSGIPRRLLSAELGCGSGVNCWRSLRDWMGRLQYVVERTLARFRSYRRIKLYYENVGEHFQALHDLAGRPHLRQQTPLSKLSFEAGC